MNLTFILVIVVIGFIWYIIHTNKKRREETSMANEHIPSQDRLVDKEALSIENVQTGGVVTITNVGEFSEDLTLHITGKHLYKEKGFEWYELEADTEKGKVWLEIEDDDELYIYLTLKKLSFEDLNITKDDLALIGKNEKGKIIYNDRKYKFDEAGKASYFKYSNLENEHLFHYWAFEDKEELYSIGIEKWKDGSYDIFFSERIKPYQVEVYSLSK